MGIQSLDVPGTIGENGALVHISLLGNLIAEGRASEYQQSCDLARIPSCGLIERLQLMPQVIMNSIVRGEIFR